MPATTTVHATRIPPTQPERKPPILPTYARWPCVGGLFQKMYHYFLYKQDEYMAHYHKRPNVESTFSMMKRKFGDSLRSKTDTALVNECLCKVLCHNLCVLNQEQHELGIDPVFWSNGPKAVESEPAIVGFPSIA